MKEEERLAVLENKVETNLEDIKTLAKIARENNKTLSSTLSRSKSAHYRIDELKELIKANTNEQREFYKIQAKFNKESTARGAKYKRLLVGVLITVIFSFFSQDTSIIYSLLKEIGKALI